MQSQKITYKQDDTKVPNTIKCYLRNLRDWITPIKTVVFLPNIVSSCFVVWLVPAKNAARFETIHADNERIIPEQTHNRLR